MTKDEARQIMDDACKVWDAFHDHNEKHPNASLFLGNEIQFKGEVVTEIAEVLGLTCTLYPTGDKKGLIYIKYNGHGFFGGWGY